MHNSKSISDRVPAPPEMPRRPSGSLALAIPGSLPCGPALIASRHVAYFPNVCFSLPFGLCGRVNWADMTGKHTPVTVPGQGQPLRLPENPHRFDRGALRQAAWEGPSSRGSSSHPCRPRALAAPSGLSSNNQATAKGASSSIVSARWAQQRGGRPLSSRGRRRSSDKHCATTTGRVHH